MLDKRQIVDKELFQIAKKLITREKLYLDPDVNRSMIMEKTSIPKNRFASLFVKFAGVNFRTFINDLRLQEAAKLMKAHPHYSISSIAIESGFEVPQSFYRLFHEKFGCTPNEYFDKVKSEIPASGEEVE